MLMAATDIKIIKLTNALCDLEENKCKNDQRISELQGQIQQYMQNEIYLHDAVQNLEGTILVGNEKIMNIEEQILTNERNHEKEKELWLSALDQANDKIVGLNGAMLQLQARGMCENLEDDGGNLMGKINEMKTVVDNLEDQLVELRRENEECKMNLGDANQVIAKLKNDVFQKDNVIEELEFTIKNNREMLFTETEFDIIVDKLKTTKSENRNLKLENLQYVEEIDTLRSQNIVLMRDLKEFAREPSGKNIGSLLMKIRSLQQQLQNQSEVGQEVCSVGRERKPKIFQVKLAVEKKINLDDEDEEIADEKLLYLENINQ